MKYVLKTVLVTVTLLGISPLFAQKSVETVDIGKLDRSMTLHKAKKRTFHNKEEFKKAKRHHQISKKNKRIHPNKLIHNGRHYREADRRDWYKRSIYFYIEEQDRLRVPFSFGRPHRDFKRGWILAYKYDRADFYDRDGFHYGYFNRYGYMFEGEFYRYDRHYRYRDRVRGRGLFDRYYYRPAEWRYYGFCR